MVSRTEITWRTEPTRGANSLNHLPEQTIYAMVSRTEITWRTEPTRGANSLNHLPEQTIYLLTDNLTLSDKV